MSLSAQSPLVILVTLVVWAWSLGVPRPVAAQVTASDQGEASSLYVGARQPLEPFIAERYAHAGVQPLCAIHEGRATCGFCITAISNRPRLLNARRVIFEADGATFAAPARADLTQTEDGQDVELVTTSLTDAQFRHVAEAETVQLLVGRTEAFTYAADRADVRALADRFDLVAERQ
jgi:hypothetical protein